MNKDNINFISDLGKVDILDCTISSHRNSHSHAKIRVRILESVNYHVYEKSLQKTTAKVVNQKDMIIFAGIIDSISVSSENEIYYATINLLSSSILLDLEKQNQSFQDVSVNYNELIQKVLTDSNGFMIMNQELEEIQTHYPIIQYLETKWSFIKRLASNLNTILIPDIRYSEPNFCIGKPKGAKKEIIVSFSYEISIEKYFLQSDTKQKARLVYIVTTDQGYQIGDEVEFLKKNLFVVGYNHYFNNNEFCYRYYLSDESFFYEEKMFNLHFTGLSLIGQVINTEKETLKIWLNIDKEQKKETAYLYPWIPPTGNLMYLMPTIGTTVSLYFPNNDESKAIAINCIRTNGGVESSDIEDHTIRGLSTEHDKHMLLSSGEVEFRGTGNENTPLKIVENDLSGIMFQSHKSINLVAAKNITIDGKQVNIKVTSSEKDLSIVNGIIRNENDSEVASRLAPLVTAIDSGQISTGIGMQIYEKEKPAQLMLDVKTMIYFSSLSDGNILYEVAPIHKYTASNFTETYLSFNDAPIAQDLDYLKIIQNSAASIGVGGLIVVGTFSIVGAIAGGAGGAVAGAKTGLSITAMSVVPAVGIIAISDIQRGVASDLDIYMKTAVTQAIIAVLTMGIDAKISKALAGTSKLTHFGLTAGAAGLIGAGTSALEDLILNNGEVDWEKAIKRGAFSAASAAVMWGWKYGVMGENIPEKSLNELEKRFAPLNLDGMTAEEILEIIKDNNNDLSKYFTDDDIENLKKTLQKELEEYVKNVGNNKRSPAISVVYDKSTGDYFFGFNDMGDSLRLPQAPVDLAPEIESFIDNMPDNIKNAHTEKGGAIGSHAEVEALNAALLNNPDATPEDLLGLVFKSKNSNKGLDFTRCPHCQWILQNYYFGTD